jgi:hypothetical protein
LEVNDIEADFEKGYLCSYGLPVFAGYALNESGLGVLVRTCILIGRREVMGAAGAGEGKSSNASETVANVARVAFGEGRGDSV